MTLNVIHDDVFMVTVPLYACLKQGEGCLVGRGLQLPGNGRMPLHPYSQEVMFFTKWYLWSRGHKSQHRSLLPVATLHSEFKPAHLQDKLVLVSLCQIQPFLPVGNKILLCVSFFVQI